VLPEHWLQAARRIGLRMKPGPRGHATALVKLESPKTSLGQPVSHMLLTLVVEPMRNWAETSMDPSLMREEYVARDMDVPRDSLDGVMIAQISLSPTAVPQKDFHVRYPDVKYALAHEFVLLHELGHAAKGWRESAADEYAFARLMLPQDPAAKAAREVWYEKMKPPFDRSFLAKRIGAG